MESDVDIMILLNCDQKEIEKKRKEIEEQIANTQYFCDRVEEYVVAKIRDSREL